VRDGRVSARHLRPAFAQSRDPAASAEVVRLPDGRGFTEDPRRVVLMRPATLSISARIAVSDLTAWRRPSARRLRTRWVSIPVPAKSLPFAMNATSPRRRSSTASCVKTSRPSSNAPGRRALQSPVSSSGRCAPILSAACSPMDSCASVATPAVTIGSLPSHAKGVGSVRHAEEIAALGLHLHRVKRFIGRTTQGFDFLGYQIRAGARLRPSAEGLGLSEQSPA
jgi:hypothetical protein